MPSSRSRTTSPRVLAVEGQDHAAGDARLLEAQERELGEHAAGHEARRSLGGNRSTTTGSVANAWRSTASARLVGRPLGGREHEGLGEGVADDPRVERARAASLATTTARRALDREGDHAGGAEGRRRQGHASPPVSTPSSSVEHRAPARRLLADLTEQARRHQGVRAHLHVGLGEDRATGDGRAQRIHQLGSGRVRASASNASIVSGRAAMVAGTSGAAANPATTPAMSSTSVGRQVHGAVGLERGRRADLGDHGDTEGGGVVAGVGRDDEVGDERAPRGRPPHPARSAPPGRRPRC